MSDRDIYEVANQLGGYVGPNTPEDLAKFLLREADEASKLADRIAALEKENAELRKALEPFANSDMAPNIYDDDSCVAGSCDFTCSDLRRARSTMADIHREQLARPRIKPSEAEGR